MDNAKPISKSKTIQGSVVAGALGVLTLLRAFGVEIDLDEGQITEVVAAFGIIISAGIAIYGRLTATERIK